MKKKQTLADIEAKASEIYDAVSHCADRACIYIDGLAALKRYNERGSAMLFMMIAASIARALQEMECPIDDVPKICELFATCAKRTALAAAIENLPIYLKSTEKPL